MRITALCCGGVWALFVALALAGCGADQGTTSDSGTLEDASFSGEDGGTPGTDSGGMTPGTDGGGMTPGTDGGGMTPGTDGGGAMPPEPPTPPASPAVPEAPAATGLPQLTSCPDGWREAASTSEPADPLTDYVTCEPYPSDDAATCELGSAHFVGTGGCQPVGDPCPAGDEWPAGVDALASVIFVNDDAIGAGLGSTRIGAYRTIGQALARATPGTTVAVAKGTYDEVLTIPNGVTVLGACAAETVIRPTATYDRTSVTEGVVRAAAASTATLSNVTVVVGVTLVGLAAYGDRNLVARGVAISEAYRAAVVVDGATFTADGLVVSDTRTGTDSLDGMGLLSAASTVQISRAVFARNRDAGILALGGTVTLDAVAILGTSVRLGDGGSGIGLVLEAGTTASVTRSLFDDNDTAGIALADAGAVLTLTDSVVRRTATGESAVDGFGLFVGPGTTATVERCTLDRNQGVGLIVAGTDARATLTDVVITRTRTLVGGEYGRGLDVEVGGRVDLDRVLMDGNRDHGLFVSDPGSVLAGSDLTVLRTAPGQASRDGIGALHVRNGAQAEIARATLVDNEEGGPQVVGAGTSLSLDDLVMRDNDCGAASLGNGLDVAEGARLELTRGSLVRSQHVGAFVSGSDSELVATDLVITDTRPDGAGERGWALRVQDGASARVERATLDGSRELAVFGRDSGTSVALVDTTISDTQANADGLEGYGLLAFGGASLTMERGAVLESQSIGVLASDPDTALSLTDVVVSRTRPSPDGTGGWGAAAVDEATVSMTRVEILESTDYGLLALDATLTATDVRIGTIAERTCLGAGSCPASVTWETGMGLVSLNRSTVRAASMTVEMAARCGVLVGSSPLGSSEGLGMTLELTESAVYRSEIGLCLQLDGTEPSPGLYLDPATNETALERSMFVPVSAVSFL